MAKIRIEDDFYPALSIHEKLRQTPESVLNRFSDLLESKGYVATDSTLRVVLDTSKQLYIFISEEGEHELKLYELESAKAGKQIRGGFFPPFELTFQLLAKILEYLREHPKDTLETAASFVILADYVEQKFGPPMGTLVRKISQKSSKLRKRISRLSKIKHRTKRPRRKSKNPSSRARSRKPRPSYIG